MIKPLYTMRTTLGLTISLMGLLGVALALTTGEIYRSLALDNQREAMTELVAVNITERLHDLENKSHDLGLGLQSTPDFRRAFDAQDHKAITRLLNNQFHQYFVTAEIVKLEALLTYDTDFNIVGASSETDAGIAAPGCPELLDLARLRQGTERLRTMSEPCLSPTGQPRYAVLVPIGGLHLKGYLQVVTDPVFNLAALESSLGIPLKLTAPDNQPLYRSNAWPPANAMSDALVAIYGLKTTSGKPVLTVAVMRDVTSLQDRLRKTRYLVIAIAGIVTLLGIALALITLQKTALRPLNVLTQQLHRVRKNKDHLGEPVPIGGIAEIRELATDFNHMASELHLLYHTLEHMAFTDPLTRLPNRVRFHDSLEEFTRFNSRTSQPFALLLMDLDRFKAVNDTLGHHVGDILLMEVSKRLRSVLRESDVIARLDGETITQLENKMVARLGGDEFAAVLPSVKSAGDAALIARKLLLAMEEPFIIEGQRLNVGMSIGIAMHPEHGRDTDTLMRRADAAMYEAKNKQLGFAIHDPGQNQDQTSLV